MFTCCRGSLPRCGDEARATPTPEGFGAPLALRGLPAACRQRHLPARNGYIAIYR